jgi:very-short-patch-repair endonuclease
MASNHPQTINYNGHETYLANDLKTVHPSVFRGVRSVKGIVTKHNIPDDQHFIVKYMKKTDSYEPSNLTYLRSKILIKKDWFDQFIETPEAANPGEPRDAPPILELTDEEKLTDDDGNVYEVEVRGERHEDKIRFKGKDVARAFQMENLVDGVQNERGYNKNEDFEILYVVDGKEGNNKKLFFTCRGLKKVLQRSRSLNIYNIQWFLDNPFIKEFVHLNVIFPSKEQETIDYIVQSFPQYECIKQYRVKSYRIDLYIPEVKLSIECDEYGHVDRDQTYEQERQNDIDRELHCSFYRFNPHADGFNRFRLIDDISEEIKWCNVKLGKDKVDLSKDEITPVINDHICSLKRALDAAYASIRSFQECEHGYQEREHGYQEREHGYQERERGYRAQLEYNRDQLEYNRDQLEDSRDQLSKKDELIKDITRKLANYSRQLQENPGDPTISEKIGKYRKKVMRLAGINESELVDQMENMRIRSGSRERM